MLLGNIVLFAYFFLSIVFYTKNYIIVICYQEETWRQISKICWVNFNLLVSDHQSNKKIGRWIVFLTKKKKLS